MSASIPDSTKTYVGSMFNREHIRGIAVFFGIGEDRPFYVEKTPSLLMSRLRHNITFFYLNYMLMAAVLFCLTLLVSPTKIIGLGLLALAWMWVIRASQTGALQIGGMCLKKNWTRVPNLEKVVSHTTPKPLLLVTLLAGISIPQKTATVGMAAISCFALLYLLSSIFWWTLFSSGFLVAVHAFLRDASMHKDMDDAVTMDGDLNLGEDASFLNNEAV